MNYQLSIENRVGAACLAHTRVLSRIITQTKTNVALWNNNRFNRQLQSDRLSTFKLLIHMNGKQSLILRALFIFALIESSFEMDNISKSFSLKTFFVLSFS